MHFAVHTRFRLARPGDDGALADFLSRLSPETTRARYLASIRLEGQALRRELARLLPADAAGHKVLIAEQDGIIRGFGEYVVADGQRADLALVVEDRFQGYGLGRALFLNLEYLAVREGIRTFTGDVAPHNLRARHLLRSSGRVLRMVYAYATICFELALNPAADTRPISLLYAMRRRASEPAAA